MPLQLAREQLRRNSISAGDGPAPRGASPPPTHDGLAISLRPYPRRYVPHPLFPSFFQLSRLLPALSSPLLPPPSLVSPLPITFAPPSSVPAVTLCFSQQVLRCCSTSPPAPPVRSPGHIRCSKQVMTALLGSCSCQGGVYGRPGKWLYRAAAGI